MFENSMHKKKIWNTKISLWIKIQFSKEYMEIKLDQQYTDRWASQKESMHWFINWYALSKVEELVKKVRSYAIVLKQQTFVHT